jgi:hypothetical protein
LGISDTDTGDVFGDLQDSGSAAKICDGIVVSGGSLSCQRVKCTLGAGNCEFGITA